MAGNDRKAIILGLDGATFDVLLPRIERGQMPNLAALLQEGVWGGLESTTPPFSAQAWVSLATGKNQARHGVVDFWEPSRGTDDAGQRRSFVTARLVQAETLWQTAGRHGRQVGVVNVPVTYPPQPVNGYLVSGFLTPQGSADFAYPPALKDEILSLVPGYQPDPFDPLGASKRQILELEGWLQKHELVARHLLERRPVDLFFSVVQALDHLQHLFWNVLSMKEVPNTKEAKAFAPLIDRCFGIVDQIIGHRRQMLDGQTSLFLVSDHGFGPEHKWFHVNRFLLERGWLALGEAPAGGIIPALHRFGLTPQKLRGLIRRLDVMGLRRWVGRLARVTLGRQIDRSLTLPIDWSQTQAVAGSPAVEGIYVNLKGRDPQGIVEPGAPYEALRERLLAELLAVRDPETNKPVVHAAYRREELYDGPFLDLLPDVVLSFGDNPYLASDALGATQVLEPLPRDYLQGRHRPTGIFVAVGPDICSGGRIEGARIIDVAPTVLYALGLPIPADMDGQPLLEIWNPGFLQAHPVHYERPEQASGLFYGSQVAEQGSEEPGYDAEEAAEMERRLRGLGYVS